MLSSIERFKANVLEQLGEGVIVTDSEGRILTVNRAAEEIHGQVRLDAAPEAYSETYQLLTMEGEPYPSHELPLARAVRGETVIDAAWKIRRPDNSVVVAVGTARPVRGETGEQIGAVLTMRNDTLRHEAEVQLKEALKLKETLLFEVNHRVRNSLQIVSSIVSLPLYRIKDPEAHAALSQTRDRIDVISATHRSLYELGTHDRVDCNRLLPDLCSQLVDTYRGERELTLETVLAGEIVLPISKAVSLCLAVTELLTNACKYAFEGREEGHLELELDGAGDQIRVAVSDNGVGIREGMRHASGTGIGTLLVSSLTGVLNAEVRCDTGPSGTRHTIIFDKPPFPREANGNADATSIG
ncbi:MAG: histidine kinase dimerization/phosphoacceptor domain -containing protein [Henriciella sp.]|uniref:sensor histidine kinase n=1 Tax=Henriciella sp. TaxID=1968823 RepID=UPI003C72E517